MPSVISAPSTKLTASGERERSRREDQRRPARRETGRASPSSIDAAATSSAHPIPSCTARRDSAATIPAPNHPPATHETMSSVICQGSTSTTLMKNSACVTTGSAWPTIIVPGINSSGTRRNSRKTVVVVANDPMPSVSKKLVTAPIGPRRSSAPSRPSRQAAAGARQPLHRMASNRPLASQRAEQNRYERHAAPL